MESPGASSPRALYPTPGVVLLSEAAIGPGRAHFYMAGREFAVIGSTLYEIAASGALTSRGTVALDANPATICSNGDAGAQLLITSGANAYIFALDTNTLTQVAALNGLATQGAYVDGYFVILNTASSTVYLSALLNGLSWAPGIDFQQRSLAPDPLVGMLTLNRYVWLFGEETSELWYNQGTSSFPLIPHPAGLIPYGCSSGFGPSIVDKNILWPSRVKRGGTRVMLSSGFQPEVVSDYPIQNILSSYGDVSAAVGDAYSERGHSFYLLSFPDVSQNSTWAWDAETRLWAERGTWYPATSSYGAQRARWYATAFNETRSLDAVSGAVYRITGASGVDVDSLAIRRMRRAPAIQVENERMFYSRFMLDLEPGQGAVTGQGVDPQVVMRLSNDGGRTWSPEYWASAGKLGEYRRRVFWNRQGSAERRAYEITVSDPTPWKIAAAYLELGQQPRGLAQRQQAGQAGGVNG